MQAPPDFESDTNKAAWRNIFQNFGTGVVQTASYGGIIEFVTEWGSTLSNAFGQGPYTISNLQEYACEDAAQTSGLSMTCSGAPPSQYADARITTTTCYGGGTEVAEACVLSSTDTSDFENLIKSGTSLVPIEFTFDFIYNFIENDIIKANFAKAYSLYAAEQSDNWDAVDKCPICNQCGTCDSTSNTNKCECPFYDTEYYPSGRSCSESIIG